MANAVSLTRFILRKAEDPSHFMILGQLAHKTQQTVLEGHPIVQLSKARTEESGFRWADHNIKQVSLEHILVVDETDVACLAWFIDRNARINFSTDSLSISPLASELVQRILRNTKVIPGSTITVPREGGFSGMARSEALFYACKDAGFDVFYF
jgi:hypothetical protein